MAMTLSLFVLNRSLPAPANLSAEAWRVLPSLMTCSHAADITIFRLLRELESKSQVEEFDRIGEREQPPVVALQKPNDKQK
jgi:hypothetical protein